MLRWVEASTLAKAPATAKRWLARGPETFRELIATAGLEPRSDDALLALEKSQWGLLYQALAREGLYQARLTELAALPVRQRLEVWGSGEPNQELEGLIYKRGLEEGILSLPGRLPWSFAPSGAGVAAGAAAGVAAAAAANKDPIRSVILAVLGVVLALVLLCSALAIAIWATRRR